MTQSAQMTKLCHKTKNPHILNHRKINFERRKIIHECNFFLAVKKEITNSNV